MRKIFLIIILIFTFLYSKDIIYFMPKDGKKAEKEITFLLSHAHEKIDIAIYSFTNKKFLHALKIAAKKGIKIRIIANKESNKNQKFNSIVPQLKKLRNIKLHLITGKKNKYYNGIMHIKLIIIDDRVVIFGSANFTYSAFYKNYEILYLNDDWTFTKRFIPIFNALWHKK